MRSPALRIYLVGTAFGLSQSLEVRGFWPCRLLSCPLLYRFLPLPENEEREAAASRLLKMMKNISRLKQWHRLIALLALCLSLTAGNSKQAFASVHTYPESPTQVMYRSQQSLRDATDKAWQAVLYKRLKSSQVHSVRLRLVGFPGISELAHPAPLRIATGTGEVWTAPDVWADSSLPANVGEYDFLQVMAQLDSDTPLRLSLPLKSNRPVQLLVPPFAVREWRKVFQLHE